MLTWISPGTTGSVISLIVNGRMSVLQENVMNEQDREAMAALGISCETRNVYYYREFKYDRLDDAIRYAEIDVARARKTDGEC
jgi:hypothetical protein